MEVRPDHLANMSEIKGKVLCAGGLPDEEGMMKGSVMVMDFPSKELFDEYLSSGPISKRAYGEGHCGTHKCCSSER